MISSNISYKKLFFLLVTYLSTISLVACNIAGSANPTKNGAKYLEQQKYSKNTIELIVSMSELESDLFEKLSKEPSLDVRFLVASNPYISNDLLSRMLSDESDFIRGGAALNPNLTLEQIKKLYSDPSHTTRIMLARNPSIPEQILLDLHYEGGIDLMWLAKNPNCPEALKKKMFDDNDETALYWLEVTRDRRIYLENKVSS